MKIIKIFFASFLLLGSCGIISDDILNLKTTKSNNSINSKLKSLDLAKNVEIKILNPENRSSVAWYKKNDVTVVMKIYSQANIVAVVTLKDETKSSNVIWSSSDNTIASVNDGKINASKIGVTTIIATSNLDADYKGILNVEVVDSANFSESDSKVINDVKEINAYTQINSKKVNSLKVKLGEKLSALASVTLSDYTKNSNVIWESSDEDIATVEQNGNILCKSEGSVSIVAKYKLNPDVKALINLEVSSNNSNITGEFFNNLTNINLKTSSDNTSSKNIIPSSSPSPSKDPRNDSVLNIEPIKTSD